MVAIIEKITTKFTRLTCLSDDAWTVQKGRFSVLLETKKIQIKEVNDFDEAKSLVVPTRHPFKEYVSSTNKFDLIIEIFEEQS